MRHHAAAVRDPARLGPGDHVAWFGEGRAALLALAVELFAAGSDTGERMFYIAEDDCLAALAARPEVARLLAEDRLQLLGIGDVYLSGTHFDVDAQLGAFTELVDAATADGFTGIRVLADNTTLVGETDDEVTRWLQWEHITDRFQSLHPVLGVCFFDTDRVPARRLAELAGSHPVTTAAAHTPPFRWFYDGDVARLTGEVDSFSIDPLRRVLAAAPPVPELIVDLSQTDFLDHSALLALAELAGPHRAVRVYSAPPYLPAVRDILELDREHLHIATGPVSVS